MLSYKLRLLAHRTQRAVPLFTTRVARTSSYIKRHIGPSEEKNEYNTMLETIGYSSIDDFLSDVIPSHIRLNESEMSNMEQIIGSGVEEHQALSELYTKMSANKVYKSYIGMGYYNTYTPTPILRNIIENPSWYTPYTPYQAEISQGRLEMLLNFQTMCSDIVGKEISNASLLDESTACAEAMTMCLEINNKKYTPSDPPIFLVSANMHPQNIAVIQQRAQPIGIQINIINDHEFITEMNSAANHNIFGAILQYPDTYGNVLENLDEVVATAHSNKIKMVTATDLLSNILLRPPGEYGVDIVVGNTQRFGVPLGFGGPHAAFLACDTKNIRKMPGRVIGATRDTRGKYALRMALQTREQHIRREKATSNICTAQALLANVAAAYAIYHGPKGIYDIARGVHDKTVILANGINQNERYQVVNNVYFDTITIETRDANAYELLERAEANGINFRSIDERYLGLSVDETTSMDDVSKILQVFECGNVCDADMSAVIPESLQRSSGYLAHEIFNSYHNETGLMRYLYHLERKDLGLNTAMIPLGSCTMKLNSASVMIPITWNTVNEMHPFVPSSQCSGYLSLIHDMESWLSAVTGFDAVSLQPNSGASGEYLGLSLIRAYHETNGNAHRNICLIPTSAHGTNPASAAMCGYKIIPILCDNTGFIDMTDLRMKAELHDEFLACCMITYPSTHGVFEDNIIELCDIIHANGGLVYMDGANMQAQLTATSPGKIGADVCHLNLHKTFCIPHGGGGPGLGPIACNTKLVPFLPRHPVVNNVSPASDKSIGAIAAAPYSSASILAIPWMYIRMMGFKGLESATSVAILNANYMAKRLEKYYKILYRRNNLAAHEFIIDCSKFCKKVDGKENEYVYKIGAEDVAKRLMDYSFHAPTMSFPIIDTLMVEPTESEPFSELDRFVDAMIQIRAEIQEIEESKIDIKDSPLRNSPHTIDMLLAEDWSETYKYSRETAAVDIYKQYWPSVSRIDNVSGDKQPICSCPSVEQLVEIQQEQEQKSI